MKTSLTTLVLTFSLVGLLAGVAVAKDGGNKGGNKGNGGNSSSNHANSNKSLNSFSSKSFNLNKSFDKKSDKKDNDKKNDHKGIGIAIGVIGGLNGGHDDCHDNDNRHKPVYKTNTCNTYGDLRPLHDVVFVLPGDTFMTIALREYNNPTLAGKIATFNRIPFGVQLIPGTQLRLPVVRSNGTMVASNTGGQYPQNQGYPTQGPFGPYGNAASPYGNYTNATTPYAAVPASFQNPSFGTAAASEPLTSVAAGSTLTLDGQQFGEARGVVRLRIAGIALPVEVLEWAATSAKVELPKIDLTQPTKADIEVLRADGTLASTTSVQLTPATSSLVVGN